MHDGIAVEDRRNGGASLAVVDMPLSTALGCIDIEVWSAQMKRLRGVYNLYMTIVKCDMRLCALRLVTILLKLMIW